MFYRITELLLWLMLHSCAFSVINSWTRDTTALLQMICLSRGTVQLQGLKYYIVLDHQGWVTLSLINILNIRAISHAKWCFLGIVLLSFYVEPAH